MDDMTLLQLATGPTSSLILMMMGALAMWRVLNHTIIPACTRWAASMPSPGRIADALRLLEPEP